ncbi:MAG: hypothetical protein H8E44_25545 [Planctomycetes bacterium]|nr:hypothetical protein [Planctomycetota bacterium]MBL7044768.1 hypothetical protein [Pirellulaceae bacterium]
MRVLILLLWLALPILVGVYHLGPGQERMVLDDVAALVAQAEQCAGNEQWSDAVEQYDEALNALPADKVQRGRRLRLERAKVQMLARKLPDAHQELKMLVDELLEGENPDPQLLAQSRAALANAQYYMTWLMRLEGAPRDVWEPEIEAARQSFHLLAQQSEESGDEQKAKRHREDLESSIRLARMDLSDLQGLPLPSQ